MSFVSIQVFQPKWIKYIYENYGIYTMLNHSFGRYGLTIRWSWDANTDYTDPRHSRIASYLK